MKSLALVVAGALLVGIATGVYFVTAGVSARPQPGRIESFAAHAIRGIAVRTRVHSLSNPVPVSDAVVKEGMEHFADHCAVCHGNDGSGNTEMGRGLYPRASDQGISLSSRAT